MVRRFGSLDLNHHQAKVESKHTQGAIVMLCIRTTNVYASTMMYFLSDDEY